MSAPFVPHTDAEIAEMLAFLGLGDLDELFAEIPSALRLAGGLDLPAGDERARRRRPPRRPRPARNRPCGRELVCFAGAGSYDHEIPAVVRSLASRSEFVTAYTPYQPEVAQGVLQALFEYQTMVARLTRPRGRQRLALRRGGRRSSRRRTSPWWRRDDPASSARRASTPTGAGSSRPSRAAPGHEIEHRAARGRASPPGTPSSTTAASAPSSSPHPNFLGCLEDIGAARAVAERLGARLVVCFDPVSAGLLRPPGELGADVVVGEGQPFGTALGFGGPYLGLFACRLGRRAAPARAASSARPSTSRAGTPTS